MEKLERRSFSQAAAMSRDRVHITILKPSIAVPRVERHATTARLSSSNQEAANVIESHGQHRLRVPLYTRRLALRRDSTGIASRRAEADTVET
jgi:hypothetical protein